MLHFLCFISYASLETEYFSITRTTADSENLKSLCAKIISRMMKQGGIKNKLNNVFIKYMGSFLNM